MGIELLCESERVSDEDIVQIYGMFQTAYVIPESPDNAVAFSAKLPNWRNGKFEHVYGKSKFTVLPTLTRVRITGYAHSRDDDSEKKQQKFLKSVADYLKPRHIDVKIYDPLAK
ncbi:hypothetical protein C4573_07020 [Candidatus Woesearchaeota archaeon]|nr:MAG: hypothetical protein C4573_07020 [Candidatus Woesearchaeota archaeon]